MDNSFPFPLDFSALNRGDAIAPETIERVYGVKRDTAEFAFKAMHLKKQIQTYFLMHRSDLPSVVSDHGFLRILTHVEQNEYVASEQQRNIRAFIRRNAEDLYIQERELSEEDQEKRRRRLLVNAWKIAQLRKHEVPKITNAKG